ncbi:type VI secretion system baseplate subunit TssK [Luteimonas sp. BDR2-5]|uniref:type VI secretion system baseplate subunit TssK n=1 Tax=Proluteimonas luteida TaxID=2878685 RepID=UPI001E542987|nr:type VI secretion system baseplate subunit TssK [Luteimonas sp. BDR2-5]MCD9029084.1 type VI secretion system baseplate subunit TssK [Luteimonas sp. BDR2-5]
MTTKGLRQVFWGQGSFLSAQHLQCQDAWQRGYSLSLHAQAVPFYWGYEVLQLREDALGSGVVDLDRFTLYTRDGERISGGTSYSHARGNARVPARNLAELQVTTKDPVSLYLVMQRDRTLDTHARGNGRLSPRHWLDASEVADPFDPASAAADVDFLGYQLQIVTSLDDGAEALLQSCEAYKFAEIVATAPGRYKLAGDYVPPVVALSASDNLARWTRALRDLLVSRGQDFAAAKRQRGIRAASTSAQEVMRLVMMQSFARYICAFQEHARLGIVSPYPLYQQLRELVAEFSAFSEDISYFGGLRGDPARTELPDYDHENLRLCFRRGFERAETLIKALTVGAEVGIALTYDGQFYKAALPPKLFESDKTRFYLAFESDVGGQELFQRLSRTGKIAPVEEMPRLLQAALFGLKIDLLPVPPEELPQKTPNTTYFLVDTHHPFWGMIRNNRNIAVFSDLPSDETVIRLYPVGAEE